NPTNDAGTETSPSEMQQLHLDGTDTVSGPPLAPANPSNPNGTTVSAVSGHTQAATNPTDDAAGSAFEMELTAPAADSATTVSRVSRVSGVCRACGRPTSGLGRDAVCAQTPGCKREGR